MLISISFLFLKTLKLFIKSILIHHSLSLIYINLYLVYYLPNLFRRPETPVFQCIVARRLNESKQFDTTMPCIFDAAVFGILMTPLLLYPTENRPEKAQEDCGRRGHLPATAPFAPPE